MKTMLGGFDGAAARLAARVDAMEARKERRWITSESLYSRTYDNRSCRLSPPPIRARPSFAPQRVDGCDSGRAICGKPASHKHHDRQQDGHSGKRRGIGRFNAEK